MHSSTWLIVIALSALGGACAGSGVQIATEPLSHRFAGGGLDGLWVAAPEAQPEGEIHIASQSYEPKADLWMKRGHESNADGLPGRETPRLDLVLGRLTPDSAPTFVEASYPAKARQ